MSHQSYNLGKRKHQTFGKEASPQRITSNDSGLGDIDLGDSDLDSSPPAKRIKFTPHHSTPKKTKNSNRLERELDAGANSTLIHSPVTLIEELDLKHDIQKAASQVANRNGDMLFELVDKDNIADFLRKVEYRIVSIGDLDESKAKRRRIAKKCSHFKNGSDQQVSFNFMQNVTEGKCYSLSTMNGWSFGGHGGIGANVFGANLGLDIAGCYTHSKTKGLESSRQTTKQLSAEISVPKKRGMTASVVTHSVMYKTECVMEVMAPANYKFSYYTLPKSVDERNRLEEGNRVEAGNRDEAGKDEVDGGRYKWWEIKKRLKKHRREKRAKHRIQQLLGFEESTDSDQKNLEGLKHHEISAMQMLKETHDKRFQIEKRRTKEFVRWHMKSECTIEEEEHSLEITHEELSE